MTWNRNNARWMILAFLLAALMLSPIQSALAQDDPNSQGDSTGAEDDDVFTDEPILEEILVTGSRIKRSPTDTTAPTGIIGSETFDQRGYVTAAEAINEFTANNPALNQAAGDGSSSGTGQQFPDLFGLGTGRTLTLVNGHRFVTSSVGLGEAQVDANIIPTGLIDRVEIVQAGGAAVYGSDAIAGVVNYILKDDFEGLEFDAQYGNASKGDYAQQNYRITWGTNFDDNRGNFAVNVEYASTPELLFKDRRLTNLSRVTQGNPADTGPNDGIPSVIEVLDAHFWNFNQNGVIYNIPAPPPFALTLVDGAPAQFDEDGNIVPYNPGQILGIPFGKGGDGFRYSDLAGLRTAVDRFNVTALGHYDVSDQLTLRGEFLYSHTEGTEIPQGFAKTVLSPAPLDAIMIFNFNPFLSPEAVATLSQASPAFGAGAPLWLSRHFYYDLLPDNDQVTTTNTYFGVLAADGQFNAGSHDFYWTVSASYGQVKGQTEAWAPDNSKFANAIFAVPDGMGGAACLINVDGNPTNDDAACSPINPFGFGNISQQATDYVSVKTGSDWTNDQVDFLALIGTDLFSLPAGPVKSVFTYEHRYEKAEFVPFEADQLGLVGVGSMVLPQSGKYHTNELSAEVLVPLIDEGMDIPMIQSLEIDGTYRWVDNSLAGNESVWNLGLRWQVVDSFALRTTYSRNFRAPTLTQLVAPTVVTASAVGPDPCDSDRINAGPNPDIRRANCEAEWAANPGYAPLEDFQDPAENFTIAQVSSGGNPNLQNELSDSTTYGFVWQPDFLEGLTFSADRIEIDLTDGLSAFAPTDFMAACYDSSPQPADICGTFTRQAETDEQYPGGTVLTAISTTFNAGLVEYRGEYFYLNYQVPMDQLFGGGYLSFTVDATHNSRYEVSVTGTSFTRFDNTVVQPDWVGRLNINYGFPSIPLQLSYQLYYLSPVLAAPDATIENNPNPNIDSNVTQSLSAQYDIGAFTLRAGVNNIFDTPPSYPVASYGDIVGRRWFVGVTARF